MKRKAVVAGSFDPITVGHLDIIKRAASLFDEVYVIVGLNPDKKCMFSEVERLEMIKSAVSSISADEKVFCDVFEGPVFRYCQKVGASYIVKGVRNSEDFLYERTLALQTKALSDETETVLLVADPALDHISSSFAKGLIQYDMSLEGVVPEKTIELIRTYLKK